MENNKSNKGLYFVLGVLCIAVVSLSIAYASLSQTLNINFGNLTQSTQSWDVGFIPGTVTGTATGTSTTGLICGDATVTKDTVSVANSTISKPGDKCKYQLTIKNNGSINATLATITNIKPQSTTCTESGASMVCGNITYKLATDSNSQTLLAPNVALNSDQQITVYLTAEYTGATVQENQAVQTGAGFTLVYNQA